MHIFCHRAARCNSPRSALQRSSQRAASPFAARCVFPLLLILPFAKRNRLTVTAPATLPWKAPSHNIKSKLGTRPRDSPLPRKAKGDNHKGDGVARSLAELTSRRHAEIDRKARRIHSRNTQGSFERHAEINQKARQNDLRNTLKSPRKHAEITRGRSGASHRRRFARPGVPAACSPYTAPHAGSTAYNRHTDS